MLTGKYASDESINEFIQDMYRESLTTLLTQIKSTAKHYAITVDETRDQPINTHLLNVHMNWLNM